MPLMDHFHAPLILRRNREGFHGLWAASLVETLNREILSEDYYADMQVHVGSAVEVDVAALRESESAANQNPAAITAWAPPSADWSLPATFLDEVEVQVYETSSGSTLVGAIELVSPGIKDRPETRRAFAAKCASYLSRGVGLLVVDIVTNRLANLHNETMAVLGLGEPFLLPPSVTLYAVSYRPSRRADGDRIDVWRRPLTIGADLPEMPLGLRDAGVIRVDLPSTYRQICMRLRLIRDAETAVGA